VQSQDEEKDGMLFNKKAEEDFHQDFSSHRQPLAAYSVDPGAIAARKANGAPTRSLVDAWLTITGNLQSEGEVQVDGRVEGDIRCAHLVVGKDATIIGNIVAEEVVVRGKVTGTIRANRVILQDSARVESEIFHKKLAIEEGAVFDGQSRLREEPMTAEVIDLQAAAAGMKAADKANGRSN
jgi:cytoskeletal protein CcmA (bactofilin family)